MVNSSWGFLPVYCMNESGDDNPSDSSSLKFPRITAALHLFHVLHPDKREMNSKGYGLMQHEHKINCVNNG